MDDSYEETSPENCSVDHEADLKHSRENLLVSYILIAYFIHRDSLMHEEEQLHDDEMTGSDALQQAGEVLGQSAQSAMDVEVLCMDHLRKSSDTRDSSSEAATLCKPGKTHTLIRDEAQVLSNSCRTVECNVDLNLSSQKQPDLAAPKTMWDSLDYASRNNATVLHELSPPEMSALFSEEKTSDNTACGGGFYSFRTKKKFFSSEAKIINQNKNLFCYSGMLP
ncbi:hypothetical protein Prudu_015797 [Prunus dulcis]|uniref:Uncharacterized protein n=1 Tax=Prunus dulcis TaxID=3755 RepID=A0A4Y1RK40_PRUDU|nr:hypothetical protein Prudu_015797 [Prunus dulcis]